MALREFSQTDLILTERKRFERRMLVMVWLGVTTLSIIHINPFYLLTGTVVFAVNFWAVTKKKEIYLPKSQVNFAIVFSSLLLVIEVFIIGEVPIVALGHYLILILLCKLFEKKTNRDYVQIMILSTLLVIAGGLVCGSLWFIIALVVYVFLLCSTTSVFILKKDLDDAADARLIRADSVMSPQQLAWSVNAKWPLKTMRRHIGVIFVFILISGTLTFFLAPRGDGSDFRFLGQSKGWGSFLELGNLDSIYLSDRIIMKIDDNSKSDLLGSYLRGKVFYKYENSKWYPLFKKSSNVEVSTPPADILAKTKTCDVFMVPDFLPVIFATENTIYIEAQGQKVINTGGCWELMKSPLIDQAARYQIHTLTSSGHKGDESGQIIRYHDLPATENAWEQNIFIHPKVFELAQDWCHDILAKRSQANDAKNIDSLNQRIAMRIQQRLREKYKYTLDLSGSDPKRDSAEDFLFYMKEGHCEYFATAMTIMCRALDVPARLATGFYITNLETQGNTILLRERDAHAWAEVYSGNMNKWIIYDPTPIPTAETKPQVNKWKKINQMWSATKFYWYEKVSGYDTMIRTSIAKWVKLQIQKTFSSFAGTAKSAAKFLFKDTLGKIVLPFAVIMPSLGLAIGLYKLSRMIFDLLGITRQEKIANEKDLSWRQLHFTRQLFDIFHEQGFPHWPEQSLRSWAMEAAYELDLPMDTVEKLVNLYYSIRWGRVETSSQQLQAAQQQVEKIAELIRERKKQQSQQPPQ